MTHNISGIGGVRYLNHSEVPNNRAESLLVFQNLFSHGLIRGARLLIFGKKILTTIISNNTFIAWKYSILNPS